MAVIADATVLSNFAHIRRLDLLHQAHAGLHVPLAVRDETQRGMRLGRIPPFAWGDIRTTALTEAEQGLALSIEKRLGAGEAECLTVAIFRNWVLLTDDLEARRMAEEMGLILSGKVGVLMKLLRSGVIDLGDADRLLQQMIAAGYHSPVDTLRDLLD